MKFFVFISVLLLPMTGFAEKQSLSGMDVYQMFDKLCDRGVFTFVPKNSVLHVPVGMEQKIVRSEGSRYVPFSHFVERNYVWIHKMPVSLEEAKGLKAIDRLRMERVQKLGKLVIAVHKGKAVTVKPMEVETIAKVE